MDFDREMTDFQKVVGTLPDFELDVRRAALLVIDMHYFQADRSFGFARKARQLGLSDVIDHYYGRLERLIIPRLAELLPELRAAGCQVIYTRVASARADGSDLCLRYRAWGLQIAEGSREADILEAIAPQPSDIVLSKTTQNVFLSTPLDLMLRNMDIRSLIFAGVVTNNCVEAAVRTAADYSYQVFVLEDCCAAFTDEAHRSALRNIHGNFGFVIDSRHLEEVLEKYPLPQNSTASLED